MKRRNTHAVSVFSAAGLDRFTTAPVHVELGAYDAAVKMASSKTIRYFRRGVPLRAILLSALVVTLYVVPSAAEFAHAETELGEPGSSPTELEKASEWIQEYSSLPGIETDNTHAGNEHAYRAQSSGSPARPNIIHIMFDDAGYDDFGVEKQPGIRMPNLDKLATEGMSLTQYYAISPVCSPTRASILTGLYPQKLNFKFIVPSLDHRGIPSGTVNVETQVKTITEVLNTAGYTVAHIGKWHMGWWGERKKPEDAGIDHYVTHTNFPLDYTDPTLFVDGADIGTINGYLTDIYTDYAIEFVERNQDGPFYVNLWYFVPHAPLEPPPNWRNTYAFYPDNDIGRSMAMMSNADKQIGRLLDKLDQLGISEQTIVVVTSDNGGALGAHGYPHTTSGLRGYKAELFEGGVRTPFIIRWPGTIPPNTTNNSVTTSMDYFSTLEHILSLRGTENREFVRDGVDVSDVFLNNVTLERTDPLFFEYGGGVPLGRSDLGMYDTFAIRDGEMKYIFAGDGTEHLFHLGTNEAEDEDQNFIHLYVAEANRLKDLYRDWRITDRTIPYGGSSIRGRVTINDEFTVNDEAMFWNSVFLTNPALLPGYETSSKILNTDLRGQRILSATFESPGGLIQLTSNPFFVPDEGDFSFTAWYREGPDFATNRFSIVGASPGSWAVVVKYDRDVFVVLNDNNGKRIYLEGRPSTSADGWHHVAFTMAGFAHTNNIAKLYIDGRLAASSEALIDFRDPDVSSQPFFGGFDLETFGAEERDTFNFFGDLANVEFRLLNLSPAEIRQIYSTSRPTW